MLISFKSKGPIPTSMHWLSTLLAPELASRSPGWASTGGRMAVFHPAVTKTIGWLRSKKVWGQVGRRHSVVGEKWEEEGAG